MSEWGFIALLVAIAFCTWVEGKSDYQEAQDQAEFYCDMVNEGTWPNYKEIDCGEDNEKR